MNFFKTTLKSGPHITSNAFLLCENASSHEIFRKERNTILNTHIKSLNAILSGTEDNKREALAHLLVLLPQCSQEVISEEGERWIRICLQNLESATDVDFVSSLFVAMSFILKQCHVNKEHLNKVSKMSTNFLSKVFSANIEFCKDAFNCLFEFLRLFPLQALSHKTRIEGLIMPFLVLPLSSSSESVSRAAKVFAVLPVPGAGGGGGGLNQAKGRQLGHLMSLGHSAMDVLFNGVQENEVYDFPREHKLPIRALESSLELNEPMRTLFTAVTLVGNSFVFIEEFFKHSTSEFVELSRKEIIRLVFRVLQVECSCLKDSSSIESVALQFILPSLHLKALSLLKALINNNVCGNFMSLVEEQLVATLKSTNLKPITKKEKAEGKRRSNRTLFSIRTLCYENLTDIIRVSKCFHKSTLEELIPLLEMDIIPTKSSLALKSATRGGRLSLMSAKKKTKKKGYTVSQVEDKNATQSGGIDNVSQCVPVTVAALALVESIFIFANDSLTLRVVRVLHKHLNALIHTRHHGVYSIPEVRASMYSSIVASAMYPHPLCPPSYAMLYPALKDGASETHSLVSSICLKGLATLSFVMANPAMVNLSDISRLQSVHAENENEEGKNLVSEKDSEGEMSEEEMVEEEEENMEVENEDKEENETNDDKEEEETNDHKEEEETNDHKEEEDQSEVEINKNKESLSNAENDVVLEVEEEERNESVSSSEDEKSESSSQDLKRKQKQNFDSSKKPKMEQKEAKEDSVAVSDMLSAFVDSDPDSD